MEPAKTLSVSALLIVAPTNFRYYVAMTGAGQDATRRAPLPRSAALIGQGNDGSWFCTLTFLTKRSCRFPALAPVIWIELLDQHNDVFRSLCQDVLKQLRYAGDKRRLLLRCCCFRTACKLNRHYRHRTAPTRYWVKIIWLVSSSAIRSVVRDAAPRNRLQCLVPP